VTKLIGAAPVKHTRAGASMTIKNCMAARRRRTVSPDINGIIVELAQL